jgi:RimJ/RimL family protein N-acetyltransferase
MTPMSESLKDWTPRQLPARRTFEGRFVTIEPLDAAYHGDGLYAISSVPDVEIRFRGLSDYPPESRAAFQPWLDKAERSEDPLFFTLIDKASSEIAGRQTLMRIDAKNGVIEIGNVYWGPAMSRKPAATEALFLFGRYVFDELGYRRFEWKCNNNNTASKKAAARFGFVFEGLFRQHMIIKGLNRDTAWFAMIDKDWPRNRKALEQWLDPSNFDEKGIQKERLEDIRAGIPA